MKKDIIEESKLILRNCMLSIKVYLTEMYILKDNIYKFILQKSIMDCFIKEIFILVITAGFIYALYPTGDVAVVT